MTPSVKEEKEGMGLAASCNSPKPVEYEKSS